MAKLFRGFLLLALVCVLTWAAVIAYWQQIRLAPGTDDVVLYLAILPLSLWLGVLLCLALWRRYTQPAAEPEVAVPEAVAAPARPKLQLGVYAAELVTPLGEHFHDVRAALQAEPVPSLDHELTDYNGFPLPARRYADLSLDLLPSHMEDAPVSQSRTAALLANVIDRLQPALAQLGDLQTARHAPAGQQANAAVMNPAWHGGSSQPDAQAPLPGRVPSKVHVQLLLDAEQSWDERNTRWLMTRLQSAGLAGERILLEVRPITAAQFATHLSHAVDSLAQHPEPVLLLLLAGSSSVCQQQVDQWLEAGLLGQTTLHFPGEAAAALLLGNTVLDLPDWSSSAALGTTQRTVCEAATLARPQLAQQLPDLLAGLQQDGHPLPEELQWLCSGMGLGPEAVEVAPLLAKATPPRQIDEALHVRGAVGEAGVAGRLSAYVLACQAVAAEQQAALLVLNDGRYERGLCLIDVAPEAVTAA